MNGSTEFHSLIRGEPLDNRRGARSFFEKKMFVTE